MSGGFSRRNLFTTLFAAGAGSALSTFGAEPTVDDFFRDFTAEWVRHDPNLATRTRYFKGEEQDRFERQLTPRTLAWRNERIALARKGLTELRRFDRARLTEVQRVSADVIEWQLDTIVREEPWLN